MAYISFQPSDFFNSVLYTGNGGTQSITGTGFQPDWLWIKSRTTTDYHGIFDSNRGSTKRLFANVNDAESTQTAGVTSFDSDGFSLGSNLGQNRNSANFVAWNWLANGGTTSSNTDGTITSTVQANTTSGFSIVTYTGTGANATVGHGLGVKPKFIIIKQRTGTVQDWAVFHDSMGATQNLKLNTNDAALTSSTVFQDTNPTTSVFSIGTNARVNQSGSDMVAYCFAETKGFSRFGAKSYTGNGNADGPFVYTGFRPAFLLGKRIDGAGNEWFMFDSKISPSNAVDTYLFASTDSAESGGTDRVDFLSNGFKWRNSAQAWNGSGNSYVFIAFAEFPLIGSNGQVGTAR